MSSFRVTTKGDGSRSVFGEHDDRDRYNNDRGDRSDRYSNDGGHGGGRQGGGGGRRGSDRSYGGGGGGRRNNNRGIYKRGRGLNPRSRLGHDEDDVDMDRDGPSNQRYNPYGKRQQPYGRNSGGAGGKLAMDREAQSAHNRLSGGGSRARGNRRNQRGPQRNFDLPRSHCGWYKVTVPFASKVDKKTLFQMINEHINVPFVPIGFSLGGTTGYFHVNDYDTAKALKAIDKRISYQNGHKMMLIVRAENTVPNVASELDEAGITLLKECMSKRYDVDSKSLNLHNFFNDPDLRAANIRVPLNRPSSMDQVLDIIHQNIIELQSLDLSQNRLMSLESLSEIGKKAPNIISLNLKANNLRGVHELNKISDLKLVELSLEGNPLCDRFKDEAPYVSAVRQRFPKVIKLDDHALPAPVTFDVEDDTKLPPTQGSYFMTEDIQARVCAFLAEYIKIYDSNDRQSLLGAYHDEAILSLTASYNKLIHARQDISQYVPLSRNLMRVTDTQRRSKMLKQGRINVISMLNELPKTEHDPNSFIVDVNLATPQLMTFCLRGVFRETEGKHGDIRYFSRTFVTVPQGQGIVILNEQYHITGATQKQVKEAFRTPAPTPSSSPVITPSTSAAAPGVAAVPALTQEVKIEMVKQFCAQSGMNVGYSERCLEENGWNYEGAAQVFMDLNQQGKIPPAAFVQS